MKKVFAIALLITALAGCSFVQKAQNYVQQHCPETRIADPSTGNITIHYECDSLYPTDKLDKCSKIDICFDARKGKISGNVQCDSLVDVAGILKKILNR